MSVRREGEREIERQRKEKRSHLSLSLTCSSVRPSLALSRTGGRRADTYHLLGSGWPGGAARAVGKGGFSSHRACFCHATLLLHTHTLLLFQRSTIRTAMGLFMLWTLQIANGCKSLGRPLVWVPDLLFNISLASKDDENVQMPFRL